MAIRKNVKRIDLKFLNPALAMSLISVVLILDLILKQEKHLNRLRLQQML